MLSCSTAAQLNCFNSTFDQWATVRCLFFSQNIMTKTFFISFLRLFFFSLFPTKDKTELWILCPVPRLGNGHREVKRLQFHHLCGDDLTRVCSDSAGGQKNPRSTCYVTGSLNHNVTTVEVSVINDRQTSEIVPSLLCWCGNEIRSTMSNWNNRLLCSKLHRVIFRLGFINGKFMLLQPY